MIKSGVFSTSVAHYPAAYKRNQFDTINEKVCEIFKPVTIFVGLSDKFLLKARDFGESPSCNLHN